MAVVSATLGHHYVVSAGHELAALAAFEVLEGGGNAIDAGVAAMLTLGVVYSDQVSVAGVAPMMIRLGATGEIVTIAGVGGWPRALNVMTTSRDTGARFRWAFSAPSFPPHSTLS